MQFNVARENKRKIGNVHLTNIWRARLTVVAVEK
jgi:hypothetical protein